ncbi:MAG: ATP-dependent protease ATPase subunit HslU [Alphaproteobacteria bacterium]|jgi:ATP-dependent HslUV protease ATP-binding subunit HslU
MKNKDYNNLSPKEIVSELDRFIIGQKDAKKAVAIALRNRYRRKMVKQPLKDEITPKNILMIGPTGVGKTEISRRLAKLTNAPFVKVESTKFTEVGYVGKDVDSIIRDLVENAYNLIRDKNLIEVKKEAEKNAEKRILDALVGKDSSEETRQKFKKMLESGKLEKSEIEIEIKDNSSPFTSFDIPGMPSGAQMGMLNITDMLGKAMGKNTKKTSLTVEEARKHLLKDEGEKLIDNERISKQALDLAENEGIVFIDEIDKISVRSEGRGGAEVSREGVQRDLLPILDGTTVTTKYGTVKTDYILFIASGAFHLAKPSDLLPELQGRLPIRVQMDPLTESDLLSILKEPESSLIKQYTALLAIDKYEVFFKEEALKEIAHIAYTVNSNVENIGARRLHTIMEKLLEEISFEAGNNKDKVSFTIDKKYVNEKLSEIAKSQDLSKFIL